MLKKRIRVPRLETERLILREWTPADAEDLYEYARDPDVGPHAGWKPHEDVRESRKIIDELFRSNETWALVEKESGRIVGSIGLEQDKYRPEIRSREMGYSLGKAYWGRGYMTEAAKRLIHYAFEELKLEVLMIRTGDANLRSRRVIDKCGFTYEGTLRRAYRLYDGRLREVRCYSMLREEFEELYR
ncbi:MAG: GNAT family N-acetyltransferase [Clostridiales bacterium]|nr:GNAT family N-acetyltransferase [Clostridiales bacterium]MDD7035876.1 GNAT family N-acetyltransferase [Bacillota bacterium]MDY2920116.1 GNAT family N-acetyltransferase [Lentihominibacter sp.]